MLEQQTPLMVNNENELDKEIKIKEVKKYNMNLNYDSFLLTIKINSDDTINFYLKQSNKKSFSKYIHEYKYEEIIQTLSLSKDIYDDITKVFKYYDDVIMKSEIILTKEKHIFKLKKKNNEKEKEGESECCIDLFEEKLSNEDIFNELYNKIEELNLKNNKNEELIKNLTKERDKMKQEIERNKKCINDLMENNKKLEVLMNTLIEDNKELKNSIDSIGSGGGSGCGSKSFFDGKNENCPKPMAVKENFEENPDNLKFDRYLTKHNKSTGILSNFIVYTALKDKIDYLAYATLSEYNYSYIKIVRIKDKQIIRHLEGHNFKITVIRYYKNKSKDYLLSCDENKVSIVWDIQRDFDPIYVYQEKNYTGIIYDALLLFNINNANYLYLSNNNDTGNENSKLFELKSNIQLIVNVYGTNLNYTYFNVPWSHKGKYYVIECCKDRLSIHNIFEDEIYAILTLNDLSTNYCGYIYDVNYLCVSSQIQDFNVVTIWNLLQRHIEYRFECKDNLRGGRELLIWNNKYMILGGKGCFLIYDIGKREKVSVKYLENNENIIYGIKSIKSDIFGECLVCSDNKNNIILFNIPKNN